MLGWGGGWLSCQAVTAARDLHQNVQPTSLVTQSRRVVLVLCLLMGLKCDQLNIKLVLSEAAARDDGRTFTVSLGIF